METSNKPTTDPRSAQDQAPTLRARMGLVRAYQLQAMARSDPLAANLGTLAVLLLFAACRKQPWLGLHVALWLVTLCAVLAKPPTCAGLLLLPASLVPYKKVPHRHLILPLVGTMVLVAALWLGQRGFILLGSKDHSSPVAKQLLRCRSLT